MDNICFSDRFLRTFRQEALSYQVLGYQSQTEQKPNRYNLKTRRMIKRSLGDFLSDGEIKERVSGNIGSIGRHECNAKNSGDIFYIEDFSDDKPWNFFQHGHQYFAIEPENSSLRILYDDILKSTNPVLSWGKWGQLMCDGTRIYYKIDEPLQRRVENVREPAIAIIPRT